MLRSLRRPTFGERSFFLWSWRERNADVFVNCLPLVIVFGMSLAVRPSDGLRPIRRP